MRSLSTALFLVGTAASVAAVPTATSSSQSATVTLDYCTLAPAAGNSSIGYYKYQNVRFAAVPTGDLRFAKPQWPPVETAMNNGSHAESDVDCASTEDCLYMDVWAPANAQGRNLPVMLWTYGGGFTAGSKSQNTPEDFIFVAPNYRLGFTGLANGPSLAHQGGTPNTALWDVEHAFKWVHKYISAFGGNPDEITAVGFSAGGSMPLFQMTRFAGHAEQLFSRAYIMSPGFVPGAGHEHGEAFYQNVSKAVGCIGGDLDCLRSVAFTNLTDAANDVYEAYDYQFQPRVDGDFVADTYEAQLYQKHFNFSGPVVISHEQHEANTGTDEGETTISSEQDIITNLRIFFPSITDNVIQEALKLYPASSYSSQALRFADMRQSFDLTAHNFALTEAMNNNTWNAMVALSKATHGTDQSYYWYSTYSLSSSSSSSSSSSGAGVAISSDSDVDSTVARKMQKYLLSFVLTGNPNTKWADDKLYWPEYLNGSYTATQLVFNSTMYLTQDDLANARSVFWNKALWY
ncbi:carboxylesterase family protein-like protein [Aspergillus brunneoviolaceus CBS 621.78]|uniref:Carboxylesterase family protein-like protein n=1 Tax=Aspergillus brunneoviolaceus CBS 621.78 TaxID=1450534 RepID=A0ACD1GIN1_9EURO|nr:carboxylesterase family protein-like protein [Aspergillus brunneoviolaceus CBS 621.78]RAH49184.1 carboxylesterase family protein-like protein [Aspergillus brunneoviolaceus CBS 621.78]